ncbi:hypothetical protein [Cellulomonas wangsupingiae]|uniref:hypothetical protein n=1 Tax=Cellulomonas wangsupingiae TaxID=2968085 RepID=UPI001D0E1CE0|nr:hypothetical protein [Cellulomonas wangsupingiae]MCM0638679.1 hypothetical protein [Cellulomonas wangsupingiae]
MSGWGPLRGLSRGMRLFVLVDVLLVVLLVVVLAVTLPGRGTPDTGGGSTPVATAPTPTADADEAAADPVAFELPSGNIACEMSVEGVVCTIRSFTYATPMVPGCEAETGHVMALDAEGAGFRCEDDGIPQVDADTQLAYGARETVGDYTCASGEDGVTCTDAAGVGFRLARAQWMPLP